MVSTLSHRDSQSLARSLSSLSSSIRTTLTSLAPYHPSPHRYSRRWSQRSSVVVGEGGRSGMRQSGIHTTAAVFVLCERRTKVLYDAIWQHILELCPELRENLRAVWTDFEMGAVASLRTNFLRIRIRGCWFHYCRVSLKITLLSKYVSSTSFPILRRFFVRLHVFIYM